MHNVSGHLGHAGHSYTELVYLGWAGVTHTDGFGEAEEGMWLKPPRSTASGLLRWTLLFFMTLS